jgi:putative hydrolase of the HAD superfamily
MKFVFDIDDTLYDLMEPFRKAFLDTFKNFDVDIQTVFIKSREHSDLVFEQSMKGEISI